MNECLFKHKTNVKRYLLCKQKNKITKYCDRLHRLPNIFIHLLIKNVLLDLYNVNDEITQPWHMCVL